MKRTLEKNGVERLQYDLIINQAYLWQNSIAIIKEKCFSLALVILYSREDYLLKNKLTYLVEQLFLLHKLRETLAKLEVQHKNALERLKFYREIGNIEMANIVSETINKILEEIKAVRKEIKRLEKMKIIKLCKRIPETMF